jgi:hypothetical protein
MEPINKKVLSEFLDKNRSEYHIKVSVVRGKGTTERSINFFASGNDIKEKLKDVLETV